MHNGSGPFRRIDNVAGGLVQNSVIIRLHPDSDAFTCHRFSPYSTQHISTKTPSTHGMPQAAGSRGSYPCCNSLSTNGEGSFRGKFQQPEPNTPAREKTPLAKRPAKTIGRRQCAFPNMVHQSVWGRLALTLSEDGSRHGIQADRAVTPADPAVFTDSRCGKPGFPCGFWPSDDLGDRPGMIFDKILRAAAEVFESRRCRIDTQVVIQRGKQFGERHRT